jgi:threonine/homoserine/homoserine lactone efflux protein
MIGLLMLGALLGLFSGVVPGPYSAMIAAAALQRGFWAGFQLAVLPVVTESLVMAVAAFSLSRLPEGILRVMGITGGLAIFYLAGRTWKRSRDPNPPRDDDDAGGRDLAASVALALLSPAPWVFWLLVGAPIFLAAWRDGWGPAVAFLGSFVTCLVAVHVALAALAGYGHRRLPDAWHRRLLVTATVALGLVGVGLVWQSWAGNFQRMVKGSEEIQRLMRDDSR